MDDLTLYGTPNIDVILRRSAQARRMTLRVSRLDGRVTLTLPKKAALRDAADFAQQREPWIRKHLDQHVSSQPVTLGQVIPILGADRTITSGEGRAISLSDDQIAVPGPPAQVGRKLQAWLKTTARSELAYASDQYAALLGKPYAKLTLRDTRSRWGSCTSAGGLMYSWRLIMAPVEVLTYVAAHEVAHLAEMNHSPAFWNTLEGLYGDYRPPKTWLRKHGHALHRYRFDD
ncbi:MAG: M48 family metallopeptidase [Paracoccaceae bacterium]